MKRFHLFAVLGAVLVGLVASAAIAQDRKAIRPKDKANPLTELISGYYFANLETRGLQDDDFDNPGFLWVDQGAALWKKVEGGAGKACASCHKNGEQSMKGVATRYPAFNGDLGRVINLQQRINLCRVKHMKAKPWKWESNELLSMTVYVKQFSRGMPMNVSIDGPARPYFEKGKEFFNRRRGQLNMSCAHCHDFNYGNRIRSNLLSQGHINGFPTYRLKWQKVGSAHRRFRGCNKQVRAKPYKYGAQEYVNLELYLAWRGNGLPVETPAVRM